jgi:hypothetical protein
MKYKYIKLSFFLTLLLSQQLVAQITVLSTTSSFTNNNGSGMVTFNFRNNNSFPVKISTVEGVTGTAGTNTASIYYKPGAITANPGAIASTNGWTLAASQSFVGVSNTTSTITQIFINDANLIVPANTTYGIVVFAPGQRYFTYTSTSITTISGGGCDMIHGPNISFGNGTPPAAPGIANRAWIGKISVEPLGPPPAPIPPLANFDFTLGQDTATS